MDYWQAINLSKLIEMTKHVFQRNPENKVRTSMKAPHTALEKPKGCTTTATRAFVQPCHPATPSCDLTAFSHPPASAATAVQTSWPAANPTPALPLT